MMFRYSVLVCLIFLLSCGSNKLKHNPEIKTQVRSEKVVKKIEFSSSSEFQEYYKKIIVGWSEAKLIKFAGQPNYKIGNIWYYEGPMRKIEGYMFCVYEITIIDNAISKTEPTFTCISWTSK